MIAALYVETNGVYFGLPDVDPWDITRDARKYAGPYPVVAHPPCARWCQLSGLVQKRYPHLRKGEDGGTFKAALDAVRTYGGVLEHPAYTRAWPAFGLPNPPAIGWQRSICGGWVAHVEQAHYGHRARKATWLYAFGIAPESLQWGPSSSAALWISWCGNHNGSKGGIVQRMSKSELARSPETFRDLLLAMARSVKPQQEAA